MADHQPTTTPEPDGPPTARFPVLQAGLDLLDRLGGQFPQPELYPGAGVDKTLHPDYLGDPPTLDVEGRCTLCGFAPQYHLDRTGAGLPLREWHRIDSQRPQGFFADEPILGVQR